MNYSPAMFVVVSIVLCGLAAAQAPNEHAASSAMVSPADGNIKPSQPAIVEAPSDTDADIIADPASLLPDPPPVPSAKASLIGGTIERLDRVRDRVSVRVFGGGRINVLFDPRTIVYRGATEGSIADLHEGERIYLDTILDGSTAFARSIRLKTAQALGESQGVVLKYRSDRGELTIRDSISPTPVRVRLSPLTQFKQNGRTVPSSVLAPGSLISVNFSSEGTGRDVAREISILALPGTRYTFAGQVLHIDLRSGLLVINSSTDHKTYEIYLDPSVVPNEDLHVGSVVTVDANFQDSRYVARNVTIESQSQ